jgi:glycosyltransferase involved in cell wall biosynthesis
LSSYANSSCDHRVAIIARLDEPGGVQSVVLSLIKGLNAKGIIPDVVWDTQPSSDLLESKGVFAGFTPVRFTVPSPTIFHFPETVRYLLRAWNVFSTDQVPLPYDFYYIFYNGFLVKDGTPHVRYLNGPPLLPQLDIAPRGIQGLPYRFFRWAYRVGFRKRFPAYEFHPGSSYVINSHFTAQLFEEAHGTRLPVVHPPIDLFGRSFELNDLPARDTITFFSRFVDYKRPEMVLDLAKLYPDRRFLLMGGVRSASRPLFTALEEMAAAGGLTNVELIANPSDEQVKVELARTLFYVFPAINEHFGMATAEAIGSGAVPYVHDSGGQREIVPDPRLRFCDEDFFTKFADLLKLAPEEINEIRQLLRAHVEGYSEHVFNQKMMRFMQRSTSQHLESELSNEFQAAAD